MPLYEYSCQKCHNHFELLVGVGNQEAILECPRCGSKDLRKAFSVFGLKISNEPRTSTTNSSCGGCASSSCGSCPS